MFGVLGEGDGVVVVACRGPDQDQVLLDPRKTKCETSHFTYVIMEKGC